MAIRTVANASQLNAAIRSASSGDTIQLKAGNYGTVKIANSSKALSIEFGIRLESGDLQGGHGGEIVEPDPR